MPTGREAEMKRGRAGRTWKSRRGGVGGKSEGQEDKEERVGRGR